MTRTEQYDTVLDHLVKAQQALNAVTSDHPVVITKTGPIHPLVQERYRALVSAQITLAQRLLDDYADMLGVFDLKEREARRA